LGQEAKTWVKSIKENEVTAAIRSTRKMHFDQKKKKRRGNKRARIIFCWDHKYFFDYSARKLKNVCLCERWEQRDKEGCEDSEGYKDEVKREGRKFLRCKNCMRKIKFYTVLSWRFTAPLLEMVYVPVQS